MCSDMDQFVWLFNMQLQNIKINCNLKKPNKFAQVLALMCPLFLHSTEICHQKLHIQAKSLAASRNSHRTTTVEPSLPFFASKCALASDNKDLHSSHNHQQRQQQENLLLSFMNLLIERQGMQCRRDLKSKLNDIEASQAVQNI